MRQFDRTLGLLIPLSLTAQSSTLQADGTIVVTETLYGAGDPRVTRG